MNLRCLLMLICFLMLAGHNTVAHMPDFGLDLPADSALPEDDHGHDHPASESSDHDGDEDHDSDTHGHYAVVAAAKKIEASNDVYLTALAATQQCIFHIPAQTTYAEPLPGAEAPYSTVPVYRSAQTLLL